MELKSPHLLPNRAPGLGGVSLEEKRCLFKFAQKMLCELSGSPERSTSLSAHLSIYWLSLSAHASQSSSLGPSFCPHINYEQTGRSKHNRLGKFTHPHPSILPPIRVLSCPVGSQTGLRALQLWCIHGDLAADSFSTYDIQLPRYLCLALPQGLEDLVIPWTHSLGVAGSHSALCQPQAFAAPSTPPLRLLSSPLSSPLISTFSSSRLGMDPVGDGRPESGRGLGQLPGTA